MLYLRIGKCSWSNLMTYLPNHHVPALDCRPILTWMGGTFAIIPTTPATSRLERGGRLDFLPKVLPTLQVSQQETGLSIKLAGLSYGQAGWLGRCQLLHALLQTCNEGFRLTSIDAHTTSMVQTAQWSLQRVGVTHKVRSYPLLHLSKLTYTCLGRAPGVSWVLHSLHFCNEMQLR